MLEHFITGRKYHEKPIILSEPKMMFVEPTTTTTVTSQVPLTTQILLWINGLTLPTIIFAAIKGTRWFTKKEEALKQGAEGFKQELALIRDNHLHHIQESLNEMNQGMKTHHETEQDNAREIVNAVRQSQDAIVNAILLTKK